MKRSPKTKTNLDDITCWPSDLDCSSTRWHRSDYSSSVADSRDFHLFEGHVPHLRDRRDRISSSHVIYILYAILRYFYTPRSCTIVIQLYEYGFTCSIEVESNPLRRRLYCPERHCGVQSQCSSQSDLETSRWSFSLGDQHSLLRRTTSIQTEAEPTGKGASSSTFTTTREGGRADGSQDEQPSVASDAVDPRTY